MCFGVIFDHSVRDKLPYSWGLRHRLLMSQDRPTDTDTAVEDGEINQINERH